MRSPHGQHTATEYYATIKQIRFLRVDIHGRGRDAPSTGPTVPPDRASHERRAAHSAGEACASSAPAALPLEGGRCCGGAFDLARFRAGSTSTSLALALVPGRIRIGGQRMGFGSSRLAESERGVWFLVENIQYLHTPC